VRRRREVVAAHVASRQRTTDAGSAWREVGATQLRAGSTFDIPFDTINGGKSGTALVAWGARGDWRESVRGRVRLLPLPALHVARAGPGRIGGQQAALPALPVCAGGAGPKPPAVCGQRVRGLGRAGATAAGRAAGRYNVSRLPQPGGGGSRSGGSNRGLPRLRNARDDARAGAARHSAAYPARGAD